jgi:hypothetical protein
VLLCACLTVSLDWIRAIGRAIVISRTKSWQDEEQDDDSKKEKTEKKKT